MVITLQKLKTLPASLQYNQHATRDDLQVELEDHFEYSTQSIYKDQP